MSDWYPSHEEKPTCELRWNTFNALTSPVLEQKWMVRDGQTIFHEWRPIPIIEENPKD